MARTHDDIGTLLNCTLSSPFKHPDREFYDPAQVLMLRTYPKFLARIATFNTLNWHSKPPCLSPPVCALYGWSLNGSDVLKCCTCDEVLYCALPSRTDENFAPRLEKVLRGLIAGHSDICPFRQKPEPAEFLSNHGSTFLFSNRLQTFKGAKNLPTVSVDNLDETLVNQIKDYFGSAFSKDAVLLALDGWKLANDGDKLHCEADHRLIPLIRFNGTPFISGDEHRPWSIWLNNYCQPDLSRVNHGLAEIGRISLNDEERLTGSQKLLEALQRKLLTKTSVSPRKRARPADATEQSMMPDATMSPLSTQAALDNFRVASQLLDSCISPRLKK